MAIGGDQAAFRLILSDEACGGQRIKTCKTLPATVSELVSLLQEDFDLDESCEMHGLDPTSLDAAGGGLLIVGLDGTRRTHIRSDMALSEFLGRATETSTPGGTRLPSLEVRLVSAAAPTPREEPPEAAARAQESEVDRLEADKARLQRENDRSMQRLDELERLARSQKAEAQSLIEIAERNLALAQERATKALEEKLEDIRGADRAGSRALEELRKQLEEVRKELRDAQKELQDTKTELQDVKSTVDLSREELQRATRQSEQLAKDEEDEEDDEYEEDEEDEEDEGEEEKMEEEEEEEEKEEKKVEREEKEEEQKEEKEEKEGKEDEKEEKEEEREDEQDEEKEKEREEEPRRGDEESEQPTTLQEDASAKISMVSAPLERASVKSSKDEEGEASQKMERKSEQPAASPERASVKSSKEDGGEASQKVKRRSEQSAAAQEGASAKPSEEEVGEASQKAKRKSEQSAASQEEVGEASQKAKRKSEQSAASQERASAKPSKEEGGEASPKAKRKSEQPATSQEEAVEEPQKGRRKSESTSAELSKLWEDLSNLRGTLESLREEMQQKDESMKELEEKSEKSLSDQSEELSRLARESREKVDTALWKEEEEKMSSRLDKLDKDIEDRIREAVARETPKLIDEASQSARSVEKACEDLGAKVDKVVEELEKATTSLSDELASVSGKVEKVTKHSTELAAEQERMSGSIKKSAETLEATKSGTDSFKDEQKLQSQNVQKRVDELGKRTEATFLQLNERLEEMGRVERARLATIEKECVEGLALARSECRGEADRLRRDYEKESDRLEMDLGDLHKKFDVTKQEMSFFKSRLDEQREWAEHEVLELRTAAKASLLDQRESSSATTKMLHALRDDAVGFREKVGNYISLLQQSTDSQGDAISTLETQRGRMRKELDSLSADHLAYVEDMDSWADDVRVKVERIFRALEPSRVEWVIARVERKSRELKRPLGLKSQGFALKGLREVAMEFYPEGHHTSPEGLAVVRMFMPQEAHVRYQVWIGRSSEGVREHLPGGSFSIDILVENWKDQLLGDGSISIALEVLRDFKDTDQSLTRDIRIESP